MSLHLVSLCFNANDPLTLAQFWADTLRWRIDDPADGDDGEVALVATDGTPFDVLFLPAPSEKPADQMGKSRIHLDLTTTSFDDQQRSVERIIAMGGSHLDLGQTADEGHLVVTDPEGNEICVIAPTNNFLAGCPRLGAINCDGTQAVGYFWSEALGWPLIWDEDEETAIRSPDGTGPIISWGGPPVSPKVGQNRLHLDLAPPADGDQEGEVARLIGLGASRIDIGQGDVSWVVMADPDGNEFCVLTPR